MYVRLSIIGLLILYKHKRINTFLLGIKYFFKLATFRRTGLLLILYTFYTYGTYYYTYIRLNNSISKRDSVNRQFNRK